MAEERLYVKIVMPKQGVEKPKRGGGGKVENFHPVTATLRTRLITGLDSAERLLVNLPSTRPVAGFSTFTFSLTPTRLLGKWAASLNRSCCKTWSNRSSNTQTRSRSGICHSAATMFVNWIGSAISQFNSIIFKSGSA